MRRKGIQALHYYTFSCLASFLLLICFPLSRFCFFLLLLRRQRLHPTKRQPALPHRFLKLLTTTPRHLKSIVQLRHATVHATLLPIVVRDAVIAKVSNAALVAEEKSFAANGVEFFGENDDLAEGQSGEVGIHRRSLHFFFQRFAFCVCVCEIYF